MGRRAYAYIDGQNFYHTIDRFAKRRKLSADAYNFNYRCLAEKLVQNRSLEAVKFYGARYPRELDATKHNRDDAFYKHLEHDQQVTPVLGRFVIKKRGNGEPLAQEKGVDVRLATDIILDAIFQKYDDAYIFSYDSDLFPAITEIKKRAGIKVFCAVLSLKGKNEYRAVYDHVIQISDKLIKECLSYQGFKPTTDTLQDFKNNFGQRLKK